MSENNMPVSSNEPITDLSEADMKQVALYIEQGLPNISTVDEFKMTRILDLYLSGKTYRQISTIMAVKKPILMYLSQKFNWFAMRKEYLEDLEISVRGRMMEARVVNQDFLLQLIHLWQKKIGVNITKYLSTSDEQFANKIDLKEVSQYLKALDALQRISGEGSPAKPSPVGLNLGDGVTIERKDDNTVEITPKQKVIGEALRQFADMRREQESKKD
jgi:hypothetical protein